ncbi:ATP-binding protein [Streptomyces sp. NPDC059627]
MRCAEVQLCVTELVTNVIRHLGEGTPVRVRVAQSGGRTRVEVTDRDPRALLVLISAADADESGRGLALLDALVLRWGVEQGARERRCGASWATRRWDVAWRGMVSLTAIAPALPLLWLASRRRIAAKYDGSRPLGIAAQTPAA